VTWQKGAAVYDTAKFAVVVVSEVKLTLADSICSPVSGPAPFKYTTGQVAAEEVSCLLLFVLTHLDAEIPLSMRLPTVAVPVQVGALVSDTTGVVPPVDDTLPVPDTEVTTPVRADPDPREACRMNSTSDTLVARAVKGIQQRLPRRRSLR
jgi:hypothetical protein